jgi:hypothetical protein
MTDPFSEPHGRGELPYWLRPYDEAELAQHRKLTARLQALQNAVPPPKAAPNPLARSWHDS